MVESPAHPFKCIGKKEILSTRLQGGVQQLVVAHAGVLGPPSGAMSAGGASGSGLNTMELRRCRTSRHDEATRLSLT